MRKNFVQDNKKTLIIILVVLIVLIGGYYLLKKKTSPYTVNNNQNSTTPVVYQSVGSTTAISWKEGDATVSVQRGTLDGSKLTLFLKVKSGKTLKCVPLNLRQIADEMGTLKAPTTSTFTFSEKNDCVPKANTTYENQAVIFNVNGKDPSYLFYTQGTSGIYFEVSTTTNKGLKIEIPQTVG